MRALRRRSKSRGQVKKSNGNEQLDVPEIITICNNIVENEDAPQVQNSKKAGGKKMNRSRKRSTARNKSIEELKGIEIIRDSACTKKKTEVQPNSSNSQKLIKVSNNDPNLSLKEEKIQKKQIDSSYHLRQQLMDECMRAIERRQKTARELSVISVDECKLRKNFDNLLKQSIKHHVTKASIPDKKCKKFTSRSRTPPLESRECDTKKERSASRNHRNSSTSTASSKKKLSDSISETSSPTDCEQSNYKNLNTVKTNTKNSRNDSVPKKKSTTEFDKSNSQKSTSSSSGSNLSSKSNQSLPKQHKEKKRRIKQNVARALTATTICTETKSIPSPSAFSNHEVEINKTISNSDNSKKLSTNASTAVSDETPNNSTLEITPFNNCRHNDQEKSRTDDAGGWRKAVSNIIAAGRSRSNSLSRSKTRLRPLRKSRSWPKSSSQSSRRINDKKSNSQGVDISKVPGLSDNFTLKWHHAILRHDWDHVRSMLKSFDHTKFRQLTGNMGGRRNAQAGQELSPLLHVDAQGWTPLHLACKEHMPSRLLRRLLFVERGAASVRDNDGRYPLHLVVMNSLDQHILDRVIHASPDSLGAPDYLNHTPIQYAVLKADRYRDKDEVKWGPPKSKEQEEIQNLLNNAYQSVLFILESMVKRRKALSVMHESRVLSEGVKVFAPPEVVDLMVILSEKILHMNLTMSESLVEMIFDLNYPLNVIHRVLETTSKIIPAVKLLSTVRQKLTDHFNVGCTSIEINVSRGGKATTSLAKEFTKSCQRGPHKESRPSPACKDWWDKLRYLVARSCNRTNNWKNANVLHMALCNPKSQPSMIEYLCRLHPAARYKRDDVTEALPIHLACMYWHPEKYTIGSNGSHQKILSLLLAGDFDLVWRRCNGRISLHYAALNGKSMPYIQTLLDLDKETISIYDPVTKLLPFQLAATSENRDSDKSAQQLNVIYGLLRINPFVLSTHNRTIDREIEMNPLTLHVLKWCYDTVPCGKSSRWELNSTRKNLIRQAIKDCRIPDGMKKWFSTLKELIWEAHDKRKRLDEGGSIKPNRHDDYFLHATLWSSSHIPPIAIELILEFFSSSVHGKEPGTELQPLHIAAQVRNYNPWPFEKILSMGSALEMITLLDNCALTSKSTEGKLPLHMAIESGKRWKDLKAMISLAPETLCIPDPSTGLFPFQMVACGSSIISNNDSICAKMVQTKSQKTSTEKNAQKLSSLCKLYELEKLTSIYSMLKAKPNVISTYKKASDNRNR